MTMKGYDLFQAIPKIQSLESRNFLLIAGPCVVESAEMVNRIAENLFHLTQDLSIPFVFKASYEKANRSRIDSFTTIGIEKSLEIIANVGLKYNIPTRPLITTGVVPPVARVTMPYSNVVSVV